MTIRGIRDAMACTDAAFERHLEKGHGGGLRQMQIASTHISADVGNVE